MDRAFYSEVAEVLLNFRHEVTEDGVYVCIIDQLSDVFTEYDQSFTSWQFREDAGLYRFVSVRNPGEV